MYSKNIDYIRPVDHLRLLAASLVFFFHYGHYFYWKWVPVQNSRLLAVITEGYTGVSLFFVLSGFILTLIALRSPGIVYSSFLRNRVLRIAPLFIFMFFVALSINRDSFRPPDLLYIFFTNIGDPPTSRHFVTGQAWSISIEFTFYLIFPFLVSFVRQRGVSYLVQLVVLIIIARTSAYLVSEKPTLMIYSTLLGRLDQFLVGMGSAVLWQRYEDSIRRMAWPLLVASIAFVAISLALQAAHFSLFHPNPRKVWWIFWPTLEAVLWASLLLAYLAVRLPWPKWVDSTLAYGGTLSFSLYMWHPTVLNLFERFYGMPPQRTALFVVLHIMAVTATTVLVSVLSYNVIERPFLDIRRSYGVVRPQPQEMGRIEILPRRKSRLDLGSELPRRNAAVDE